MAGLRILDPAGWQRVLTLLDDPSAAVVREVTRSLAEHASSLPEDELLTRIAPEESFRQRAAALRLLSLGYGSGRLLGLMRMLEDPHPCLRARAAREADRAWTRSGDQTPEETEEMLELLERHADALPWRGHRLRDPLQRAWERARAKSADGPDATAAGPSGG